MKANQTLFSSDCPKKLDSENALKVQAVCLEGDHRQHNREGGKRERRQEKGAFVNGLLLWATRARSCRGPSEECWRTGLRIVLLQGKEAGELKHQSHFLVVEGFSWGP